jgi:hypothetical protein
MNLKLFGGSSSFYIPDYTIVPGLLFDVAAITSDEELSPYEKLFIVKSIGEKVHSGYLANVYMKCGCFNEAKAYYIDPRHPRKLGDICWCEAKLDEAKKYYREPASAAQPYRRGPDIDRLIKLAFFREYWTEVINVFCEGNFGQGVSQGRVILGASDTAASPYLEMLLVALHRQNVPIPIKAAEILKKAFDMSPSKWAQFVSKTKIDDKLVSKLKNRCRPRVGAESEMTITAAISKGDTVRARHIVSYIRAADDSLEVAQRELETFGETGSEVSLTQFIQLVTGSGIRSLSHSFLFAALGHDSFCNAEIPPERLIRLLGAHPIMNKRHFGKLLDLRFKNQVPLTSDDILTGIFQSLGHSISFDEKKKLPLDNINDLSSYQEWARVRLDDWLHRFGKARVNEVTTTWNDGRAQAAVNSFWPTSAESIKTPRNTAEWQALVNDALTWLRVRWRHEIATTPWVSENQLFQILRRKLKPIKVLQHFRPTWLEPQHLDIYLPEFGIGIEYMGQQHFEPLDYFGGQTAYEAVVERDKKKAELCKANGITLIYVRFDEDIGSRALEIANHIQVQILGLK